MLFEEGFDGRASNTFMPAKEIQVGWNRHQAYQCILCKMSPDFSIFAWAMAAVVCSSVLVFFAVLPVFQYIHQHERKPMPRDFNGVIGKCYPFIENFLSEVEGIADLVLLALQGSINVPACAIDSVQSPHSEVFFWIFVPPGRRIGLEPLMHWLIFFVKGII